MTLGLFRLWLDYGHTDFGPLLWTDLVKACVYIAPAQQMKSSTPFIPNARVSAEFTLDRSQQIHDGSNEVTPSY